MTSPMHAGNAVDRRRWEMAMDVSVDGGIASQCLGDVRARTLHAPRRCVGRLIHSTVCCCRRHLDGSSPSGRELQRTFTHTPPSAIGPSTVFLFGPVLPCALHPSSTTSEFPPLSLSQPAPLPPPQMPPVVLGGLVALAFHHVCLSLGLGRSRRLHASSFQLQPPLHRHHVPWPNRNRHQYRRRFCITPEAAHGRAPQWSCLLHYCLQQDDVKLISRRCLARASWLATRRQSRHALSLAVSLSACLMHHCRPSFSVPCPAVDDPALVQPTAASTHDYKFSRRCVLDASVRLLASSRFNVGTRPAN
jgi:hypothetical protein